MDGTTGVKCPSKGENAQRIPIKLLKIRALPGKEAIPMPSGWRGIAQKTKGPAARKRAAGPVNFENSYFDGVVVLLPVLVFFCFLVFFGLEDFLLLSGVVWPAGAANIGTQSPIKAIAIRLFFIFSLPCGPSRPLTIPS
jgi:hypothetical protein